MEQPDTPPEGFFGRRLSKHLGMEGECLLRIEREGQLTLAVTRLSCSRLVRERTAPVPCEPAFSILHQLDDLGRHSCGLACRTPYSGASSAGTVRVIDLRDNPRYEVKGPFDAVQYYVPQKALDKFAQEHGVEPVATLKCSTDQRDPFVSTLSSLLLSAAEQDRTTNKLFVDQIGFSLLAHFAQTYGGLRACSEYSSGRLAPWQERRAKEMMRARLASRLTIGQVAAECRLSRSYFARAFRRSTGVAPHEFLSQLRIDEAKHLMLATKLPLADIALICGFGDQSHLTRVFSRGVGVGPAAWRRARSKG